MSLIGMSLKLECHSNGNVTQIGVSLKLEYHKICDEPKIGLLLKLVRQSNWNVT